MKPRNLYTGIIVLALVLVAAAFAQDDPVIEEPSPPDEESQLLAEVQSLAATITLGDSGWSDETVGNWDPATLTGTLTKNLTQPIQIVSDGITLEGGGYTINSPVNRSGIGIYILARRDVTIKNVNVTGFHHGMRAYASSNIDFTDNTMSGNNWALRVEASEHCTLTGNNASYNWIAFYINRSNYNTLTSNTASNNNWWGGGFDLNNAHDNILRENVTLNNATYGILLSNGSSGNTITNNIASNNSLWGIYVVVSSNGNTVTDNTCAGNRWHGINICGSSNNLVRGNTLSQNSQGILINSFHGAASYDNTVYNNYFIDNSTQASVSGGSGNVFNRPAPDGGNSWSDWTYPDADKDGFIDNPYIFSGGQDDLPLAPENEPPVADAGPDQTAIAGETVQFDGRGSFDPDGSIVSYEWSFGDGAPTQYGPVISHAYDAGGIYTITLTVTDDIHASDTDTATVTVITPAQAIEELIGIVKDMNLQQGIANSLDAKLDAVRDALVAANAGVRQDAVNKLGAFVNAVEAQRAMFLTDGQADELIIYANRIIAALGS